MPILEICRNDRTLFLQTSDTELVYDYAAKRYLPVEQASSVTEMYVDGIRTRHRVYAIHAVHSDSLDVSITDIPLMKITPLQNIPPELRRIGHNSVKDLT